MKTERSVRERYSEAATAKEAALCCPIDYNREYLKIIPQEVLDRDYGCGDPSKYLNAGETVLDLGSGGGKICFIASQVVGSKGKVIGVDMNDDMLKLARTAQVNVASTLGYDNVEFFKGKIQDMRLDRDKVDAYLSKNPLKNEIDLQAFEGWCVVEAAEKPMIADSSVDVVVSNCVLNLVDNSNKKILFEEIFRVLKKGGRAVISDIVSDEVVPQSMQEDEKLWSGCISGAFQELEFLKAFEDAGFYGLSVLQRDDKPWQTVNGIEFRSVTLEAFKGKQGDCWDHNEAVVYKGPFSKIEDDDGHTYIRGERVAVCRKTKDLLSREPYAKHFDVVKPMQEVIAKDAKLFSSSNGVIRRDPKETKGKNYKLTSDSGQSGGCC